GLGSPVHLTAPAGDDRLFIVEQEGRIRIIEDGELRSTPFLDLTDRVRAGGERGLLSMAFHPDYTTNHTFFVYYTDRDGDTRVERYTTTADPAVADPSSASLVLAVDQPFSNHNGGLLTFGPDGMLYIGLGDGGSGGDPHGHGQNRATLLGSILRVDVDGDEPYAIPPDNPFVSTASARPEIWAYGLRNPWRFTIDAASGDLYIADVGQGQWEEVNVVDATAGGLNFGWNLMEGAHCFASDNCDRDGLVLPVLEYDHGDGCSVTGGLVYRGTTIPEIVGHYFYADYCAGWVRSFRWDGQAVVDEREWSFGSIGEIYAFGEDAAGELYVLASGSNGAVHLIEPAN
ncbi:MAG: PQQ-dependent sugar dehydrogenase, partial [Longimicrobiales bacterium]